MLNFIIKESEPFNIVRGEGFQELIHVMQPSKTIMSYETVINRIDEAYETMKKNMMREFGKFDRFCITTDCWTVARRGFMGVIVHWLDESLKRHTAVLACSRLKGHHTFDVLAESINNTLKEFSTDGDCVTDNARNFVKADFLHRTLLRTTRMTMTMIQLCQSKSLPFLMTLLNTSELAFLQHISGALFTHLIWLQRRTR